ncbi:hypothetical protein JX266_002004 [Neoarthrinium moseri]|nr:hypothetical protein JX266_002004 [Neoarthrinium moseri]
MRAETLNQFYDWGKTFQRGREQVIRSIKAKRRADPTSEPYEPHYHHQHRSSKPRFAAPAAGKDAASSIATLPACLYEIPSAAARGYGLRSSSRRLSFLSLAPELRNMVYQYCVHYPGSRELFDSYYIQREKRKRNPTDSAAKGKQAQQLAGRSKSKITREALTILRARVLVIDRIPPWVIGETLPLPISSFITKATLQSVRYVELRLSLGEGTSGSGRVWSKVLTDLLKCLDNHNLVKFKVVFKLKDIHNWPLWFNELCYYELIMNKASLSSVIARTMLTGQQFRRWEHDTAKRGNLIDFERWIIDRFFAYKHSEQYRNPLISGSTAKKSFLGGFGCLRATGG